MSDPRIKLKRSSVSGKIPSANDLPLGELALNTYDGKLYASKNVGIGTTVFAINPWSVGLGSDTYNTFFTSGSVGIGTSISSSKLHVVGNVNIVGISTFTGDATLSNIILNGSVSTGTTTGISGQYLKSVGTGVTWASFPTLRTGNVFTAGAAQTSFTVSYNVGFVDVYINGVRLTDSEFTGTSGTSIVLNESCFGGETVDILAYNTTSTGSGGGGISTESQTLNNVLGLGNTSSNGMSVGVVTATSFSGSGTNLTGIVTSIVAGTNVTISGSTGQVTINASGGGGGSSQWVTTDVGIHTLSNVGIGTTNPTSKLFVVGDGYFTGVVTATNFYVGNQLIGGSISGTDLVGTALSVSGISTFTNGPVLIGTATSTGTASQRLQVTGGAYVSGNLGVGVTNPTAYKVQVAGTFGISEVAGAGTRTLLFSSGSGFTLNHNDNSGITFQTLGVNRLTYSHSSNLWTIPSETSLLVGTGTSTGTSSQPLQVTGGAYVSGNLGIGTTNPTSKLTVVGVVSATSFSGSGSNLTGIVTYISAGSGISVNQNSGNVTITAVGSSEGSWTVSAGSGTYSFTVPANATYVMWVRGSIPSGICIWNATVSISNTNVPVIGNQYGWYYVDGNQLVLTAIPSQIIGTSGSISTSNPAVSNTNTFSFGITNNSGTNQTVFYGYKTI